MRKGFAGLPSMRTRTGSGLRQSGLMARAREALTGRYGLPSRISHDRCEDELGHPNIVAAASENLRTEGLWLIVTERHCLGDLQERAMSHQPPKESKKKPQQTPKEKKLAKQQKKHAGDTAPFLKQ